MALNQYISVFKKNFFLYSFQVYQNHPALGELIKREETAYTNRKTLTNTFNFCSQLIQLKIVVSEQYVLCAKSLQSCPTLCDPVDCSPPGSSVHRTLQARMLEWVALPCTRGSFQLRDLTCISFVSCIDRRALYH